MSAGEATLSDATVGATVNADNPWPGLLAFSETDKAVRERSRMVPLRIQPGAAKGRGC